jgi:hypothetical protein
VSSTTAESARKAHPEHHVHFYEHDTFLCEAVTEFVAAGLQAGQPLLVVVTFSHCRDITNALVARGFNVKEAEDSGQLRWLDAGETLSSFMDGKMPDPVRFRSRVGTLIETSRSWREHQPVRVFGEMVDVLCSEGNPEGALVLEELWNELGRTYGFSLMCAYAVGNLYREEHWRYFEKICDQHAYFVSENDRTKGSFGREVLDEPS